MISSFHKSYSYRVPQYIRSCWMKNKEKTNNNAKSFTITQFNVIDLDHSIDLIFYPANSSYMIHRIDCNVRVLLMKKTQKQALRFKSWSFLFFGIRTAFGNENQNQNCFFEKFEELLLIVVFPHESSYQFCCYSCAGYYHKFVCRSFVPSNVRLFCHRRTQKN